MVKFGDSEKVKDDVDQDLDDNMEEDDIALDVDVDSDVNVIESTRKKRKLRSIVWSHFTRLTGKAYTEENPKAKCNYCGMIMCCHSKRNGTKSMKTHLEETCVKDPLKMQANKLRDDNQTKLVFEKKDIVGGGVKASLQCKVFSLENTRRLIAMMIIKDELPFAFVENIGFRELMEGTICLFAPDFVVPSRTTVAKDVMDIYMSEKKKLRDIFVNEGFRISLTTDTWTSVQNINYMVLTAHFIDNDWIIHKRIISFCQIENHKGDTIGKEVEKCLKEWGIAKVLTLTVDNASSNDTAVAYLVKRFKSGLVLNGEFLHLRCCAHILNLIVGDGLKDVAESITKIRNAVRFVRSSPARLAKFKRCIAQENICSKNLVSLNVPTRWNSTYLMLDASEKFEKAFDRLEDNDLCYLSEETPCNLDWEVARIYIKFLSMFYGVTKRISGSLYVTSNSVFHEISIIQRCIRHYSSITSDEKLSDTAQRMQVKFEKYWGNTAKTNILFYVALVLDPRYKMKFLAYAFSQLYSSAVASELCKKVDDVLRRLFTEYSSSIVTRKPSTSKPSVDVDVVVGSEPFSLDFVSEFNALENDDELGIETEVDVYLLEAKAKVTDNFNILHWWKLNAPRFVVLSKIARDILAMPVSTVASESAFSTGGRVIDPFRSSLAPRTVEALICTQNWIKSPGISVDLQQYLDEVVKTEEEFIKCMEEMSLSDASGPSQSQTIGDGLDMM